jgi:hypothetical protein
MLGARAVPRRPPGAHGDDGGAGAVGLGFRRRRPARLTGSRCHTHPVRTFGRPLVRWQDTPPAAPAPPWAAHVRSHIAQLPERPAPPPTSGGGAGVVSAGSPLRRPLGHTARLARPGAVWRPRLYGGAAGGGRAHWSCSSAGRTVRARGHRWLRRGAAHLGIDLVLPVPRRLGAVRVHAIRLVVIGEQDAPARRADRPMVIRCIGLRRRSCFLAHRTTFYQRTASLTTERATAWWRPAANLA